MKGTSIVSSTMVKNIMKKRFGIDKFLQSLGYIEDINGKVNIAYENSKITYPFSWLINFCWL